ncbi:hypothetical protein [Mycoplasma sp. ATU-Cv-508]|uniref:hypothetical protein n=1 Tax=Mycoplasma sp. ATU-Cv-508 TaxID=2048001 RepID=UPI000FDD67E3
MSTLDFIVNLSIRWKQNFLDIKQVQEYQGEFTHYSEQIKIFRDAVRSHKFETKLVPVKRIKTIKQSSITPFLHFQLLTSSS